MDIPQKVIDDLILALHQSQNASILLGGTSGQRAAEVSLHTSKIRHRNQQKAISSAIRSVLEFASPQVQARVGGTYRKRSD